MNQNNPTMSVPYAPPYAEEGIVKRDHHGLHVSVGGVVFYCTNLVSGALLALYRPDRAVERHEGLGGWMGVGVETVTESTCSCGIGLFSKDGRCGHRRAYPRARRLFDAHQEAARVA